ncbi:MAG: hypothetical protein AAF571_03335 [Verrucomicrobiota bacterium]
MKLSEVNAVQMLRDAEKGKRVAELPTLNRHHTEAVKAVIDCQARLDKLKIEQGKLAPTDVFKKFARTFLTPLKIALDNMPRQYAKRCNPVDPTGAEEHLDEWAAKVKHQIAEAERNLPGEESG